MKEKTIKFLNLLFNEGETICASDNKYAYHSVTQDLQKVTLIPPEGDSVRVIREDDINLVAINPIKGFRKDKNVTSFRTFLVELDDGSLLEQKKYIDEMEMPYSICVFSGNKSLHYGIVLSEDLFNEKIWRFINKWILNIMTRADQQNLNPTKSIRFPGNVRKDGKMMVQELISCKERIDQATLYSWLNKHIDKKPVEKVRKVVRRDINKSRLENLPRWVMISLESGITMFRNNTWFNISCAFANAGYGLEESMEILSNYYVEDDDFRQTEWETCIKSGHNKVFGAENG